MNQQKKEARLRQVRRQRLALGAVSVAVLLVVVLATRGLGSRRQSDLSEDLFSDSYDVAAMQNPYKASAFSLDGQRMTYKDPAYVTRLGIDVSEHNEQVDWQAVKAAGYDFVFLRLGYRGYGADGTLNEDARFEENYQGAKEAGLDVGVYFFAQAVDEAEAKEEAQFVLRTLHGRTLELPVAYDMEDIENDTARTDAVTGEQFTENVRAFCLDVAEGGYQPMLYTNQKWQTTMLDMRRLSNLPVWLSYYGEVPGSGFDFQYWQYSESGQVDGIEGKVDLNIQFIPADE